MAKGHGRAIGGLDQVAARAVRRLRPTGARFGAAAATLAAASLLQACSASGAVATTTRPAAPSTTRPTIAATMRPAAASTTSPESITGALVAPDGRHVFVPYTAGGCVVGAKLTAAETGSTVTLVLRQVLSGASICPADLILGDVASVTLPHPLWGRSLVDGSTGRRIPYLDGRKLLRVTYLPPGFRFSAYLTYPVTQVTDWEREFVSAGQATAPVDVVQVPGTAAVGPSWPVTAQVTVGGRRVPLSVLTSNGQVYGRAITWRADGYAFSVYTVQVRGGQRLLSAAELTGIANGLRS
jgi:hypothetical protein